MGTSPSRSAEILFSSLSTRTTSCPRSAKHAPVTNPTYPEPTTAMRIASLLSLNFHVHIRLVGVHFLNCSSLSRPHCLSVVIAPSSQPGNGNLNLTEKSDRDHRYQW